MNRRGAELFQAATMLRRGIAFVRREIISGKDSIQFRHDRVAGRLGDDRCGGYARRKSVALDDAALWSRTVRDTARINQNEIRLRSQDFDCATPRQKSRVTDVQGVEFLVLR